MSQTKFVRAIFPGTFDPITNGHLDVIGRGMKIVDELIIAVGDNPHKKPLFTGAERVEMIRELVQDKPEVKVERFTGLMVDFAKEINAQVILRGLRNLTDVQYEFQLALTNRAIGGLETVFIMTSEKYGFTTSTLIREVGKYGGDVSNLIPADVYKRLKKRLLEIKNEQTDK